MTDSAIIATEVGSRITCWLKQAYPRDGAKLAARDFDASPHTARRWFEGARPENRHFDLMVRKWGKLFVDFVYGPMTGQGGQNGLSAEVARLKADVEYLKRSVLRSPFDVGPDPLADRGGASGARRAAGVARASAQSGAAGAPPEADVKEAAQ